MKKSSKLQFTEEERADPILEKVISKSEKAATKLEKAQAKIPKKKIKIKERTLDAETGKTKVRLRFEEVDKPKPSSKLSHEVKKAPTKMVTSTIHKEISKSENDNVGVEAVHGVEKSVEFSAHRINSVYRHQKAKPYQKLATAEKKSVNADVNYLYQKSLRDNPELAASNPISKWQQKQAIKKQYILTKQGQGASTKTATTTASTVKATVQKGADWLSKSVVAAVKNPKVLLIILAVLLVAGLISAMLSSTAVMFQGMIQNVVSTSYTSEDADIVATDEVYTSMETDLQTQIDNIESDYPGYDEYNYDLDSINHNSHQLASYLTALLQYYDPYTANAQLQRMFNEQYELTINQVVEVRYRTESRTGHYTTTNADGTINHHTYTYDVEVPYDYYILNVTLDNKGVDAVANSLLSGEKLEMYQVYLQSSGNKPLLFGGGSSNSTPSTDLNGVVFVNGERVGNENTVNIALSQVGNVGGEPYWSWYGFDSRVEWCACYVSWVLNQAGYSEPTFAACQSQGIPYFTSHSRWASRGYDDIAAGDVIFFDWEGDGSADHVGIVVGSDGSRVYTVEGNSGDACKVRDYALNSSVILGYGLMN